MEGTPPLDAIKITSVEVGYQRAAPHIDFYMTTLAIRELFNPIAYEPALLVMYQNGIGHLWDFPH